MTYLLEGVREGKVVRYARRTTTAAFRTLRRLTALGWQVEMVRDDGVPVVDAPSSENRIRAIREDGGILLSQHYAARSERPTIPVPYVSCAEEVARAKMGRPPVTFPASDRGARTSPNEDRPTIPCPPISSRDLVFGGRS